MKLSNLALISEFIFAMATSVSSSVVDLPANDEAPLKTVNVRIKGNVQGVYYRKWTVETAQQLGLNGWVRNRRDGSVEAVFSGKPAPVDSIIEKCRIGPSAAVVTAVEVKPVSLTVPPGFERRPTE